MTHSIRHAAVLFLCVFGAALLAYQIPVGYELHARITASGQFQPLETLPERFQAAWQDARKDASPLSCRHETPPTTTLHCTQRFERRSQARGAVATMEDFSSKLGWTSPLSLKAKTEALREEATQKAQERDALTLELEHVPGLDEASSKALAEYERKREFLATEIDNRKRQLELIREALAKPDATDTAAFTNKEKELTAILADLQSDQSKLDQEFSSIQDILRKQSELRSKRDALQSELESTSALVATMETSIEKNLAADRLEDPTTFQIQSGNREIFLRPLRDASSLAWSWVLGFFVYALWMHGFRKTIRLPQIRPPSSKRGRWDPKDLEPWLKAPYLGEIHLRPPEVRESEHPHTQAGVDFLEASKTRG